MALPSENISVVIYPLMGSLRVWCGAPLSGRQAWRAVFVRPNRRAIRESTGRDAYWLNIQRRLAKSDAAFLTRYDGRR